MLNRLDYQGALHATFDDGRFPEGTQVKSRWVGEDDIGLDAIMRVPLEANNAECFLNLANSLSESMDMDHVGVLSVVHWPGGGTPVSQRELTAGPLRCLGARGCPRGPRRAVA